MSEKRRKLGAERRTNKGAKHAGTATKRVSESRSQGIQRTPVPRRSTCCGAVVHVAGRTTRYYVCGECHKTCVVVGGD